MAGVVQVNVFIDLFSGLGGASRAFDEAAQWTTIKIDNNSDLLEHNRGLHIMEISDTDEVIRMLEHMLHQIYMENKEGIEEVVIWASPPCTEFSYARADRIQSQTADEFDMTLIEATRQIIEHIQPDHWILENVHGAIPIIQEEYEIVPTQKIGSIILWGKFPHIGIRGRDEWKHRKLDAKGTRALRPNNRAIIPYPVSRGLLESLTQQTTLFDF